MTRVLVLLVALVIFGFCRRKYGLKLSAITACLIALALPGVSLAGMVFPSICRAFGLSAPSPISLLVGGGVAIAVAAVLARRVGWGKVLGWTVTLFVSTCAFSIMGFLFFIIATAH